MSALHLTDFTEVNFLHFLECGFCEKMMAFHKSLTTNLMKIEIANRKSQRIGFEKVVEAYR